MSESFYGTLSLGTQGCTYMCQLVLNGPSRGRVLYCDADGAPPYFPPDADFLSWLERWLDELLEGRSTDSFGYGPIGSELSFCETLQNKARSDDERASALHGLWRFTTLSQASVNTLLPLRTHPDSSVRTLALALSNKHKFDDHLAFDQRALDDDSKKVRHDAYRRLLKTNAAEIRAKALSALYTKSDAEIAFTIYYALVKEDLLSQQDLEKLLAHKDQAIVKDVIPRFEFDGQHESTLLHLSQSDDEQIRLRACKTLTALKTPQAFAALLGTLKSATLDTLERLITLLGTFSTKDVSERLLNAAESQVRPVPALQV